MENTRILVANASEACLYETPFRTKLFAADKRKGKAFKSFKLIETLKHSASRERESDLVTDRRGHCGRGSFIEPTSAKAHEKSVFALELSKLLEEGRAKGQFQNLIIVAPPNFYGRLKQCMNGKLSRCVSLSVVKDYTKDTPQQLSSHLAAYL